RRCARRGLRAGRTDRPSALADRIATADAARGADNGHPRSAAPCADRRAARYFTQRGARSPGLRRRGSGGGLWPGAGMSTTEELRESRLIAEQAARWVCDLRGADQQQHAQFLSWLKRSPLHVREFLFAATVWRETTGFLKDEPLEIEQLIAE